MNNNRRFGGGRNNDRRDGNRNNNFSRGPMKMHKATCSGCKKECEVPFKPTEGRDVFCKECFAKKR